MNNFNGKTDPLEMLGCDEIVLTPFAQGFVEQVQLGFPQNPFNRSDERAWAEDFDNGVKLATRIKRNETH